MHDDPNADLIGYRIPTGTAPDTALVVTGTTRYSDQYVYCDVLDVFGKPIGTTVRQAKQVRALKLAVAA